jgi:hypothetical protein
MKIKVQFVVCAEDGEHGEAGDYAASSSSSTSISGYHRLNTEPNSRFRVLMRICSSKCAPRLLHWLGKGRAQCLCLFLHPPR